MGSNRRKARRSRGDPLAPSLVFLASALSQAIQVKSGVHCRPGWWHHFELNGIRFHAGGAELQEYISADDLRASTRVRSNDGLAVDACRGNVLSPLYQADGDTAPRIIAASLCGGEKNPHSNSDYVTALAIVCRCLLGAVAHCVLRGILHDLRIGSAEFDFRYMRTGVRHRESLRVSGKELTPQDCGGELAALW